MKAIIAQNNLTLNNLKVTFLVGTLASGGAERQLFYMLQCLKNKEADIKVLCLTKGEHYEKKILGLGVPVIWVGRSQLRPVRLMRIFFEIVKVRPDIFQSLHSYTNIYSGTVSRLLKIKSIASIRCDFISEVFTQDKIFRLIGLYLSNRIVANSKNALLNAANHGFAEKKLYYLPNVVDTNYFKPLIEDTNRDTINILSVGRLEKQKRNDRIIEILSELKKRGIKYKAKIVGAGELENELKKQANNLGLLPNLLEFIEFTSDVLKFYQWANVFLHTPDFEGTPNVVMEAMACGLPIVTTNVGDTQELVDDGITGFLFELDNTAGMVNALKRIANDQHIRKTMGQSARESISKNRSLFTQYDNLSSLYRSLIY